MNVVRFRTINCVDAKEIALAFSLNQQSAEQKEKNVRLIRLQVREIFHE